MRNELAKAKAEFEREKKKLVGDHTSQVETLHSDFADLRANKEKQEKVLRKKLEDATAEHQRVVTHLDEQICTLQAHHQSEFARVKERVEI